MTHVSITRPPLRPSALSIVVACATVAIMSGCANYIGIKSDKTLAQPQQFESSQSIPAQGGQWPAFDWASQFGDPQLQKLIDEALDGNPTIAQAQARIAKASSYIETSKSALYPKANASYSWTRELYSANGLFPPPYGGSWYSENNVLASASWDLDLWGKKNRPFAQASLPHSAPPKPRCSRPAHRSPRRSRVPITSSPALRAARHRRARNRQPQDHRQHHERPRGRGPRHQRRASDRQRQHRDEPGQSLADRRPDREPCAIQLGALLGKGSGSRSADRQSGAQSGGQRCPTTCPPISSPPGHRRRALAGRRRDARRQGSEGRVLSRRESRGGLRPSMPSAGGKFLNFTSRQMNIGPAVHLPIFDAGALRAQLKRPLRRLRTRRRELRPDAHRRVRGRGDDGLVDPFG